MAQLRQRYDDITKRGAEVVVVGPERRDGFARYFERERLPFVGLPDPSHEVADLFGQEVKLLKLGRMPAQVVVDRSGVIRAAHYGSSMSDIPKASELLEILDGLG